MKTITIKLYSFAELSEKAKDRAHTDSLRYFENPWARENWQSLEEFCKLFPCSYRREYMEFTGDGYVSELSGQRLATYIWNNYRDRIYTGKYYYANGKSRHSRIQIEVSCPFTGYIADDVLLDEIVKFMRKPDSRDFEQLLRDCISDWETYVKDDEAEAASIERFAEDCEANEWTFEEDGTMRND